MAMGLAVAYFFGGVFVANALPHLISGMMGRAFQSPFAKPSGQGYSSSTINVLWGFFNLVLAYVLLQRGGGFQWHRMSDAMAMGLGMFLMSLFAAHHFGRFNGGRLTTLS